MRIKQSITGIGLLLLSMVLVACGSQDQPAEIIKQSEREVRDVINVETASEIVEEAANAAEKVSAPAAAATEGSLIALPEVDPLAVNGDIVIAGSSTVFPLAERMIEVFENEGFGDLVTYDSIGSGGGFERFCEAGESDISGASRGIKEGEIEACAEIGRTPIEFRIGTDALAVVVSAENDFVTGVTHEELAALFSTAETWADINPSYPNEPILRYIPGTDSGTFDFFVEEVFDENTEPILAANNTELSEDDNVLVTGVVDSPYAVTFFGYAYYQENASVLKILDIDGIEANQENVDAGAYPLARPLIIYSDASIIAEKQQVGQFLSFLVQNVNREIGDIGYFPANPDVLGQAAADLAEAMGE